MIISGESGSKNVLTGGRVTHITEPRANDVRKCNFGHYASSMNCIFGRSADIRVGSRGTVGRIGSTADRSTVITDIDGTVRLILLIVIGTGYTVLLFTSDRASG